ncbi:ABC transporter ATP-binding protein, partial [Dehalococcoidia bacterium]|nr:ABC transporter ATP-binding protein [Dehalococcoidia bacterium]MCL0097792.1 ABC transporter ATP-binding protein [Dehalococcoidia bacterium]
SLGLTKEYNNRAVVKNAWFDVRGGVIFGFLGPNGAGKTTTIRMLTTIIRPTRGTAEICGYDIRKEALRVRQSMAVVPQNRWLNHYLSVFDNVMVFLLLHGLPFREAQRRTREGLERFDLTKYSKCRCEELSGGEIRRVQIVRALALDVKCLFLDEPSVGLDVVARRLFWKSLRESLKERDITVFLTTHLMQEVEALCEEVALIQDGEVQHLGRIEELKATQGTTRVELRLAHSNEDKEESRIVESLATLPQVTKTECLGNGRILIHWEGENRGIPQLLATVADNGGCIENVSLSPPTLEEIYLRLVTQRKKNDVSTWN